ncbi:uncharacterized protein L201_004363 [Kwoniella dendrophila CBS 6074]|uniref:Rhodopsin domain-containing protein n=1 Tax=Kwoniella dendrophila CBS 6074 TaxID=1295534 RepID=A0AAX4JX99_9TREE
MESSTFPLSNRSPAVFTVTLVLLVLSTLFTIARLISKWLVVKKRTSDDWVALLAWFFAMAMSVSILIGAKYGLGKADADLETHMLVPLKRSIYAFTTLYNPALMTTKTSILILYIRMSSAHPFLRYASWFVLGIVDISGVVLTFLNIFQCKPISTSWKRYQDGKCIDLVSLYLSSAPINILTDLAILLFPLPILTSLRMEFRQKIILVTTFLVGGFVTIVDIVRIVYLQTALKEQISLNQTSTITANNRPPNFTWHISFTLMWSAVEVNIGLICCCVLCLKPLVLKIIPQIIRGKRRKYKDSTNGNGNDTSGSKSSDQSQQQQQQPRKKSALVITSDKMRLSDMTPHMNQESQDMNESCDLGLASPLQIIGDGDFNSDIPAYPVANEKSPKPNALRIVTNQPPQATSHIQSNGHADGHTQETEDGEEEEEMDFLQMLASTEPLPNSPISPINEKHLPDLTSVTITSCEIDPVSPEAPSTARMSASPILYTTTSRWFGHDEQNAEAQQEPTQKFFDFVNMAQKKDLTQLTRMEAWWPILFVSSLFFMWGFGYSLLSTLNAKIEVLLGYTPARGIILFNAYWLGYTCSPFLLGYWALSRSGFRTTFIFGLSIYSIGALAFWPSSVLHSYAGFCVSNFIIAFGLSTLEVSANPYISLAGPGELAEARLNFAQGIQAVGVVVSPILAEKVLFKELQFQAELFNVQWCYLAVSLFVVALAVVFFYVPIPETEIGILEAMALQRLENAGLNSRSINSPKIKLFFKTIPIRYITFLLGPFGIWLYTGSQESLAYYWNQLHEVIRPNQDSFWDITIGHSLFAIGRFLGSCLLFLGIPPRILLLVFTFGASITSLFIIILPKENNGTFSCMLLSLFFQSIIFPTIFAMSLKNQGKYTWLISSCMISGCSGAGHIVSSVYGIYKSTGYNENTRKHQWIPFIGYTILFLVVCWENSFMKIRKWFDPRWSRSQIPIDDADEDNQQELNRQMTREERRESIGRRGSTGRRGSIATITTAGGGTELRRTKTRWEGRFEGWSWGDGFQLHGLQ